MVEACLSYCPIAAFLAETLLPVQRELSLNFSRAYDLIPPRKHERSIWTVHWVRCGATEASFPVLVWLRAKIHQGRKENSEKSRVSLLVAILRVLSWLKVVLDYF